MEGEMKLNLATSTVRRVDKALTIYDLFDGRGFNFDFVVADLDGDHGSHINRVSDRVYFVISGTGKVTVGSQKYDVAKDDLIVITRNTLHSISGQLRFLIITAPPFDPANEELLPS
jgi:mannose-6-phosphate isomerase-like protein (cupin superfamily)